MVALYAVVCGEKPPPPLSGTPSSEMASAAESVSGAPQHADEPSTQLSPKVYGSPSSHGLPPHPPSERQAA